MKPSQTISIRGSAIIEAAFTTLPFLILVSGIIEGAHVLRVQQALTNAAREGARFGVAPERGTSTLPGIDEIETQIRLFLQAAALEESIITIERPVVIQMGSVPTEFTRVTVTIPYEVVTVSLFSDLEMTLSGQALMRNETSP